MRHHHSTPLRVKALILSFTCLGTGLALGAMGKAGLARLDPPSEHRGVTVSRLGVLPADMFEKQIGVGGYIMQLREITLDPGGAIARHSHAKRPGLVWTVEGTLTEGRTGHPGFDGGERDYSADGTRAIVEDAETDHWFFNNGSEPARAVVCDIVPHG